MLTKSNYLLGLQCPNLLWISKNEKERIPKPDVLAQQKFDVGTIIGEYAKKVFEGGIDLADLGFKENIENTKKKLGKKVPLFEAGFLVDNLFSRADVLCPVGNKWDIIEVKSATKVKDINLHDVAFQKYVYEKAGLKIRKCFLMHINNEYSRDGELEPKEFFVQTDVTDKIPNYSEGIKERADNMLNIIKSTEEPKCAIGVHCSNPYDCSLKDNCWKEVPENSVMDFYRMFTKKKFELYDNGIKLLNEVPDNVKLNDKQKIQRLLAENGGVHKDKEQIDFFLKNLKYPLYYLDFETINPAIPKFDGMKPYQRIPFQFSLHVQKSKGSKLEHISFLAEGTTDPRPKFMQTLKDNLGDKGDILVYNQAFEKGVMNEGQMAFPEFKEWYEGNILPRVKDLWDVFRNFWYYDSKQKGSASIKYVLPVMSDLSYSKMDIKNGAFASYEYERVTYGDVDEKDRKKVRDALEKYCGLDTLAEVRIVERLGTIDF
ncbi:DUF2779 domain-containing protein [Candidatus Pacearchaeota archaeon]|nr:DUF2779 domain-containing protein [Candidatus Pacearchaeota archaeon]